MGSSSQLVLSELAVNVTIDTARGWSMCLIKHHLKWSYCHSTFRVVNAPEAVLNRQPWIHHKFLHQTHHRGVNHTLAITLIKNNIFSHTKKLPKPQLKIQYLF